MFCVKLKPSLQFHESAVNGSNARTSGGVEI